MALVANSTSSVVYFYISYINSIKVAFYDLFAKVYIQRAAREYSIDYYYNRVAIGNR